jgi:hypothetical protein
MLNFTNLEVVLFYWPPNVSTAEYGPNQTLSPASNQESHSARRVVVIPEVTFRGEDRYLVAQKPFGGTVSSHDHTYIGPSTMTGPFTLTSPTIYMAHHQITYDYLYEYGFVDVTTSQSVRLAGVTGLKLADVSSIVPLLSKYKNDTEYASLIANGKFEPQWNLAWATLPLKVADLQNPVPARSFFDARLDCWGEQTHCGTITDDSYRPRLVIASSLWGAASGVVHGECLIPDVVDPPVALTAITDGLLEEGGPPLLSIPREPGQVDWNVAASATAMLGNAPYGSDLSLKPRATPTGPWSMPTATSRSTPYNAAVYTSGSSTLNREFVVEKWVIPLALSVVCIFVTVS